MNASPWLPAAPLAATDFAELRQRAIFDCCKWDPQMEDASAIAQAPLLLRREAWDELARLAERLAAEALAAESELVRRVDLHRMLALPWSVRRALARAATVGASTGMARLMRFDFHHTTDGWRISEANTDVPGGLNEASGFAALFAPHFPGAVSVGDTVATYADAVASAVAGAEAEAVGGTVALVHATAFTDDRQVMAYVARALETRGIRCILASPAHLRWRDGRAACHTQFANGSIDAIVRFFPGEWLSDLGANAGVINYFAGGRTPMSNPATALLTQSKRWALTWRELDTPLPTWRALLPETAALADSNWRSDDWVIKPALGRVGEDVGVRSAIPEKQWKKMQRHAWLHPGQWVAQRKFDAIPVDGHEGAVYPCVGVYTVDGRAAGAYGRVASRPLIDWRAQDAAVMCQ